MADFQGAVPVQTARDDEFKVKIVDFFGGSTATAGLKVEADGSVNTNSKITDGTDTLAVNSDGSINVVVADGTEICDYQTSAAVATNGTDDFDYVVTSGKTFKGQFVLVGGRGATQATVGTYDGTTFVPKAVYFQQPAMNIPIPISTLTLLGDGTAAIRVTVKNLDKSASDLYCTIQGAEL